eukprot:6276816-Prymnesium_polylepis.1
MREAARPTHTLHSARRRDAAITNIARSKLRYAAPLRTTLAARRDRLSYGLGSHSQAWNRAIVVI